MRRESEVGVKRDPQDAWITIERKSSVLQGDRRMSVGLVCVGSKESLENIEEVQRLGIIRYVEFREYRMCIEYRKCMEY